MVFDGKQAENLRIIWMHKEGKVQETKMRDEPEKRK